MSDDSVVGSSDPEALLTRAVAAEKACAIRDAALRDILNYVDREWNRAAVARQALRTSTEAVDQSVAFARLHEISGIAGVVKRLVMQPTGSQVGRGWVSPKEARQVHEALLACFQQLQDPPLEADPKDFGLYRKALELLAGRLGL